MKHKWQNNDNGIIRHLEFSKEEIMDSGFRDGRDGICFYPPSCWGTDDRMEGDMPKITSFYLDSIYRASYITGREQYKKETGHYPYSGYTGFDFDYVIKSVEQINAAALQGAAQ